MASFFAAYKGFVRKNSAWLSTVEGGLSSLTWLLPDRFSESELTLESVHSILGLLSLLHESIVNEPAAPRRPSAPIPWPLYLGAVQQVEVLGEIAADRYRGPRGKYSVIGCIEFVKAIIRLCVLYSGGGRILLEGGSVANKASNPAFPYAAGWEREERRKASDAAEAARARRAIAVAALAKFREDREKGLGAELEGGDSDKGKASAVESRALWWAEGAPDEPASAEEGGGAGQVVPRPLSLPSHVHQGQRYILAGEVLHVMRPVAYAVALRRWGRSSWRPWLVSLAFDCASNVCCTHGELLIKFGQSAVSNRAPWAGAAAPPGGGAPGAGASLGGVGPGGEGWSQAERGELARRKLQWGFYLLRSPCFEAVARPPLELAARVIGRLPLVGGLSGKALEILYGIQAYHFYLSAS